MKICIVGAGAIGGVLAFRLASAGHEVSAIARGAHLNAILDDGLTLVDHLEERKVASVRIAAAEEPAALGQQDVVFIALKAHAIPAMLPRLAPLIGPHTTVVPAINGLPWWYFQREGSANDGLVVKSVDPKSDMARHLPAAAIVGCVVHIGAEVVKPGVVHHTGGRLFILGEIDQALADPITPRLRAIGEALDGAKLDATLSKNIRHDVWAKLIGNLSFNPIAAITYANMARICANEELLDIIRAMLREGKAVASAYGVHIAMTPDERIGIARMLGSIRISMHQDFESQRTPEISAIVGSVIELAARAQVPVPVTRMIRELALQRAISEGLLPG
jgi:2-dehydropantoate 2-reductase